jgi:hypothetical protein
MTVEQATVFLEAYAELDGYVPEITVETVTKEDPKTGEKTTTSKKTTPVRVPYNLGAGGKSGDIRWNIAKNMDLLEAEHTRFEKLQNKAILSASNGTGVISRKSPDLSVPDPEYDLKMAQVNKEVRELLDKEIEVSGLLTIKLADLNLDENPHLSVTTLKALRPLITE